MKKIFHFEKRILALGLAGVVAATALPVGGLQVQATELSGEETADAYRSVIAGEEMHTIVTAGEEPELYRFIPEESGVYQFFSIGEEDTYGYLYDEEQTVLAEANDGGEGLNFLIEAELEEGVTYYLQSDFFMEEDGEITSLIEEVPDTYDPAENQVVLPEDPKENTEDTEQAEVTADVLVDDTEDVEVDTAVSGNYEYTVLADGTVKIVRYTGTEAKVTIPDTLAGKKVTVIGEGAFTAEPENAGNYSYYVKGNTTLQTVIIPKSVTEIQYAAFDNCQALANVSFASGSRLKTIDGCAFRNVKISTIALPNTVKTIGQRAFTECKTLSEIAIPDSVTEMGIATFAYCDRLSKVTLGKGLQELKEYTFISDTSLQKIQIPSNIKTIGNYTFESSGLTEITIPDSVTTLGKGVFYTCPQLKTAWIGDGVTEIRRGMFRENPKLQSVRLPAGVTKIELDAFKYDTALESIALPEKLKEIEPYVFCATGLKKIKLPSSLQSIGESAFAGCGQLSVVTGGENVTYMGPQAFEQCPIKNVVINNKIKTIWIGTYAYNKQITTLKIPKNVTEIQYGAFAQDENLANITFHNNLEKVASDAFEGTAWFKKQPNGLVYTGSVAYTYKGTMAENTTLTIKNGTKGIGAGAFRDQTNLTGVKLPSGLKVIDIGAFAGCTSMKQIELPSSVKEIGWGALGFEEGDWRNQDSYDYSIDWPGSPEDWGDYKDDYKYTNCFPKWEKQHCDGFTAMRFDVDYIKRIPGFVIIADKGSAGEAYAKKFGITYQERTKFNIQYNLNGGKNASGNPAAYTKTGNTITLKNPTRAGYKFMGWYTDAGFKNKITKINKGSIGDKTLYAKWAVQVRKITLNKTKATLIKSETLTLKATVSPSNAANKAVTWKSSNTKVATVTSSGKVTAKGVGTAIITCTAKDGSGRKATCKITVRKYTNTESYVARIYTKALGRNADIGGMKYWAGEINAGRKSPTAVAEMFITSPEFTNKNLNNTEYVKVLYRTFMGREYDQGGLDYWVGRLNQGESRKSILQSFAGCPEFQNIVKSFGL